MSPEGMKYFIIFLINVTTRLLLIFNRPVNFETVFISSAVLTFILLWFYFLIFMIFCESVGDVKNQILHYFNIIIEFKAIKEFSELYPEYYLWELNKALCPKSSKCKQLAWFGDSILNHTVTKILMKKYYESAELLHERRKKYTNNKNIACFLEYGANDVYKMIYGVVNNNVYYSDSTLGTVFEAILCWAYYEDKKRKENNWFIVKFFKNLFVKEKSAVTCLVEKLMDFIDNNC